MSLLNTLTALFRKTATAPAPESLAQTQNEQVLTQLGTTLRGLGWDLTESQGCLTLSSGIELQVEYLDCVEFANGNFRTMTRTIATHPHHFPNGLPEYQHAVGNTAVEAMTAGFSNWAEMDLVTLNESFQERPTHCNFMDVPLPATPDSPAKTRRVVFGPVGHMAASAPPVQDDEHAFCPCCLFTKSIEAFRPALQSDDTLGIRLFATRDIEVDADCRINGDDFPAGVEQLKVYVHSWPEMPGMEFRKQYIVIRTIDQSADACAAPPSASQYRRHVRASATGWHLPFPRRARNRFRP